MFKQFLLLAAVVPLAAVLLAAPGRGSQATSQAPAPAMAQPPTEAAPQPAVPVKNPVKPTAESQAKAKSIYGIDCAVCHGDNGNGKTDVATSQGFTLNDWTDPKAFADREDWELFNVIRNGKGTTMPSEPPGRATDTEVWNLVIYIRSFSKSQPPAPAPAAAAKQD